ncbi:MAG TPA: peptidylprolyl isomerase [Candidatus Sumerlaeota bacterium]|nr:peptidylprolyl isomerase [Candidatus Sumerlaeota bacterium]HPS01863.1 peptidylprolyl isomerase [Candidatus Sumerlaeota bacterium]
MSLYVNGEPLDEIEITREAERLRPYYEEVFHEQPAEAQEQQLLEWARENVIERVLLQQAAVRDPEPLEDAAVEEAYQTLLQDHGGREQFYQHHELALEKEPEVKDDIRRHMLLKLKLDKIATEAVEPGSGDAQRYYEEHRDEFVVPETVHAAHIIKQVRPGQDPKAVEEELLQVLKKIRNNADFTEMAQQHSDCPDGGGDLGFFPRGQMVESFEEVVFNLEPGGVSNVFRTEFGLHIAKVFEKRESELRPFEYVEESIQDRLREEANQEAIERFIDGEREKATLEERADD